MKTLVIDARMILHSGIGTYLLNLLPHFMDSAFRVVLIGDPIKLSFDPSLEILPCDAPIYSYQEQITLPKLIPECDLFWSPHFNVPIPRTRAKARVTTIHDVFHLMFKKNFNFLQRTWAKILMKQAATSDQIITVSQFSKSEILKFFPNIEDKVKVIPLGVDKDLFSEKISMMDEMVKIKYQIPTPFILFVGSCKPHKNLKRVVEAFKRIEGMIHLIIVGKRDPSFQIPDERIQFLEYVQKEELASLYRQAKLLVFPSLYEGFGLPPLEAMSSHCATLVSSSASLPEVCGDAAHYVDPENVEEIKKGIEELIQNNELRERLIQKGQTRVNRFDWRETAVAHLKIFESICDLQ